MVGPVSIKAFFRIRLVAKDHLLFRPVDSLGFVVRGVSLSFSTRPDHTPIVRAIGEKMDHKSALLFLPPSIPWKAILNSDAINASTDLETSTQGKNIF